jgi:hypothetical protein
MVLAAFGVWFIFISRVGRQVQAGGQRTILIGGAPCLARIYATVATLSVFLCGDLFGLCRKY